MDKISTFGELLYIGFNYEKGICKSKGVWKFGYKESLKKHLVFLRGIVIRINIDEVTEEDNNILINLRKLCESNKGLKRIYFSTPNLESKLNSRLVINKINNNHYYEKVINKLMLEMIEELLTALNDKPINKKKVHMLLRALHNLPRFYFNIKNKTFYNLQGLAISYVDAVKYSFDNMDDVFKEKHKKLLNDGMV